MFFSSWFCCSHCFMSYLPYFHCHSNKTFFIEEIVNSRNSQNWTNPGNTVTRPPNALQCIVLKWLYNWVKIQLSFDLPRIDWITSSCSVVRTGLYVACQWRYWLIGGLYGTLCPNCRVLTTSTIRMNTFITSNELLLLSSFITSKCLFDWHNSQIVMNLKTLLRIGLLRAFFLVHKEKA